MSRSSLKIFLLRSSKRFIPISLWIGRITKKRNFSKKKVCFRRSKNVKDFFSCFSFFTATSAAVGNLSTSTPMEITEQTEGSFGEFFFFFFRRLIGETVRFEERKFACDHRCSKLKCQKLKPSRISASAFWEHWNTSFRFEDEDNILFTSLWEFSGMFGLKE